MNGDRPEDGTAAEPRADPAELVRAWKDLLSSEEAANFVDSFMERITVLLGRTPRAMFTQSAWDLAFFVVALSGVGLLGHLNLVPDGTTGVLIGIIIGYFFKRDD